MIFFESLLTTFDASVIFEANGASSKIVLSLPTKAMSKFDQVKVV